MKPNGNPENSSRLAITVAFVAAAGIALHLSLRFLGGQTTRLANLPLYVALAVGGIPLVVQLAKKLWSGDFGSDFLAGVSIVTGILLREYLVATIVVLMLSGGTALEVFASRRASRVLDALARRMPSTAPSPGWARACRNPSRRDCRRRCAGHTAPRNLPRGWHRHRRSGIHE